MKVLKAETRKDIRQETDLRGDVLRLFSSKNITLGHYYGSTVKLLDLIGSCKCFQVLSRLMIKLQQ